MSDIIPIFIPHAGCGNMCIFCNQRRVADSMRPPAPAEVQEIVEKGLAVSRGRPQIAFYGGSFTAVEEAYQNALLEAALPFVHAGRAECIRISTRPDCVDEAVLHRLRAYRVGVVELGAQSMDDGVLRTARRGHTAEDVERAARLVKSQGFSLILQMMAGLPGDSPETLLCSGARIAALRPDGVRIYPVAVLRDTELYRMWQKGVYRPPDVREAASLCGSLLELFFCEKIPVIRVGLNPSEDLSAGGAVAGAYHPAFGEMARSAFYLRRMTALLCESRPGGEVTVYTNPAVLSQTIGQHRENITELEKRFALQTIRIEPDAALEKGMLRIENRRGDGSCVL